MGFRNGAYAAVFSVNKGKGNYYEVNLATSKKDNTGNYVTDFRGFVRFVGDAATKIAKLDGKNSKDNGNHPIGRVKLGSVDVSNNYNANDKKTYTNFVVFSFEFPEAVENGNTKQADSAKPTTANDYVNNVADNEEDLFT